MKKTQRSFNSTIRKSGRPKKTNPARRKREFERCYGSKEYVQWIHTLPCVACDAVGWSECAHVGRSSGMGRKGSWRETVPLCGPHYSGPMFFHYSGCHRVMHQLGRAHLEEAMGIDLEKCAAKTQDAWASLGSSQGGET